MTQLDYSFKQYYPKWQKGNDGSPTPSLKKDCVEIILCKQPVCDKINDLFETSFKPLVPKIIDYDLGFKIKEYLTKKENHFIGITGSIRYDLTDE